MFLGKGATLFGLLFATAEHYRGSMFLQPMAYGIAAVWIFFYPRSASWLAGPFFLFVALHSAFVLPAFQGTNLDLVRRPISIVVAAWFAYALFVDKKVRLYLRMGEPNHFAAPTPSAVH
jgi:hypothetical protein